MARNRVIYQSQALYSVATGEMTGHQLMRVQDVSHTVDIARQDVNEFGKLASISRDVVEPPTVGTDFSYYLGSGHNEAFLGFTVNGIAGGSLAPGSAGHQPYVTDTDGSEMSCISGLISEDGSLYQKNLYVRTVTEGLDVDGIASGNVETVLGIGNAFITDYTLNAAVGDVPTVSISVEATNLNVSSTISASGGAVTGATNPGVDNRGNKLYLSGLMGPMGYSGGANIIGNSGDQILPAGSTGWIEYGAGYGSTGVITGATFGALRPGEITVQLGSGESPGVDVSGMHVQNASVSIPLSRTSLNKIGNKYSYYKAPDFPVTCSMSVSAIVGTMMKGNVSGLLCGGSPAKDIYLNFQLPCSNQQAFQIKLKNAQLDSQNFSSSVGDNQTVDLTWSSQVGGPEDTDNGIFMNATGASATSIAP